jgi:hypothetical protein
MNKRKFPKAVLQTADQMREAGASDAPMPAAIDNVIEMVPKSGPASAGPEPDASAADPAAALRRRKAVAIVERLCQLFGDRRRHSRYRWQMPLRLRRCWCGWSNL